MAAMNAQVFVPAQVQAVTTPQVTSPTGRVIVPPVSQIGAPRYMAMPVTTTTIQGNTYLTSPGPSYVASPNRTGASVVTTGALSNPGSPGPRIVTTVASGSTPRSSLGTAAPVVVVGGNQGSPTNRGAVTTISPSTAARQASAGHRTAAPPPVTAPLSPPSSVPAASADLLFATLDRNHDGVITRAEFNQAQAAAAAAAAPRRIVQAGLSSAAAPAARAVAPVPATVKTAAPAATVVAARAAPSKAAEVQEEKEYHFKPSVGTWLKPIVVEDDSANKAPRTGISASDLTWEQAAAKGSEGWCFSGLAALFGRS